MSQGPVPRTLAPSLDGTRFDVFESWLEEKQAQCAAVLCAVTFFFAAGVARFRPLEYDEVFTYYVAKLPRYSAIYTALRAGADDHPPLDYWIRHASLTCFGVSDFALRIPSVFAFTACLFCVWVLVRKNFGPVCALSAVGVMLLSKLSWAAYVGRSYILIALATAGGLLAWRYAADRVHRVPALCVLAALFFGAPSLHYYAPFHLLAIAVAECIRTWRRRSFDWPMWLAFATGLPGCVAVWPLLPVASSYAGRFWTPVSLRGTLEFYPELFTYGLLAACLFLVVVSGSGEKIGGTARRACAGHTGDSETEIRRLRQSPIFSKSFQPERAAAVYLLALPFVLYGAARFTHALQPKYAISLPIGAALLVADAISRSQRLRLAGALSFAGLGLVLLPVTAVKTLRDESPAGYLEHVYQIARHASLPLVIDNSHTFVQSARYAPPDVQRRLFYLDSVDSAARIGGKDTDERALSGLATVSPMQVVPEDSFLRAHSEFLVFHDRGWLLEDLLQRFRPSMSIVLVDGQPLMKVNMIREGAVTP